MSRLRGLWEEVVTSIRESASRLCSLEWWVATAETSADHIHELAIEAKVDAVTISDLQVGLQQEKLHQVQPAQRSIETQPPMCQCCVGVVSDFQCQPRCADIRAEAMVDGHSVGGCKLMVCGVWTP